jgi:hypothetical protein
LAIFEDAATEALQSLDALGLDERGQELRHEAATLVTVFRSWRVFRPEGEERAAAIARGLALSRNVAEYLVEFRMRVGQPPT